MNSGKNYHQFLSGTKLCNVQTFTITTFHILCIVIQHKRQVNKRFLPATQAGIIHFMEVICLQGGEFVGASTTCSSIHIEFSSMWRAWKTNCTREDKILLFNREIELLLLIYMQIFERFPCRAINKNNCVLLEENEIIRERNGILSQLSPSPY